MLRFTNPFQYGDSFSSKVEPVLYGICNFFSLSTNPATTTTTTSDSGTTTYSGSFARQMPSNESYDAIVVGGGHNGLVAAAYLAKSGVK